MFLYNLINKCTLPRLNFIHRYSHSNVTSTVVTIVFSVCFRSLARLVRCSFIISLTIIEWNTLWFVFLVAVYQLLDVGIIKSLSQYSITCWPSHTTCPAAATVNCFLDYSSELKGMDRMNYFGHRCSTTKYNVYKFCTDLHLWIITTFSLSANKVIIMDQSTIEKKIAILSSCSCRWAH